jgi:hypothetical protein
MALWPIFRVARSSRTDQSMLVARALKIGQIADVQLALQRAALEHIQTKVCHRLFWGVLIAVFFSDFSGYGRRILS